MISVLQQLPYSFWIAVVIMIAGAIHLLPRLRQGYTLPTLAVMFTVAVWYIGDVFYNDYDTLMAGVFPPDILTAAWWEVALFLVALMVMVPYVHRWWNKKYLNRTSYVFHLYKNGLGEDRFQDQIEKIFYVCLGVWFCLVIFAAMRVGPDIGEYFFPFLGEKVDPWGRGRLGGGIDFLLSTANYIQLFTAALFGVVAASSKRMLPLLGALAGCVLTWPNYIFDRTRNVMLVMAVPAILILVFFRVRGPLVLKLALLVPFFLVINIWLSFVIANRMDFNITQVFKQQGVNLEQVESAHHDGLNMYEELCWINQFISDGTYRPNWGYRYFSEIANPIPRSVWPGKPFIGLDYSVLRGQGNKNDDSEADVNATISTGMIGQGVVNFGRILGPVFAAFLMSMWVAILARLDLTGQRFGHVPLFALSLILTFNLGRDITLITLYTLVFGSILVWIGGRIMGSQREEETVPVPVKRGRRKLGPRRGPIAPQPDAAAGQKS